MASEGHIAENQLQKLKNNYIPLIKEKLKYFYQISAESTNLSTKLLSRPDVTLYNSLQNSCLISSKLLNELHFQLQSKYKYTYEQILIINNEKSQTQSSLTHLDTKIDTIKNQLNMIKEEELSYLNEIEFLKVIIREFKASQKLEKKMMNEAFKNNLIYNIEQEQKIAEYYDKFSLLKQEAKKFNRQIFELEMNIYKYSELRKKIVTEIEGFEKEISAYQEERDKNQNEIFDLELNIKYIKKKTQVSEEEYEKISRENRKFYNKIADMAIEIEKKKQRNINDKADHEKSEKQLESSIQLQIVRDQEDFEVRKTKIVDRIFYCNKITGAFETWASFTDLSKCAEQAMNENNKRFEEIKQTELKKLEDQKKRIESCYNNKKKNQRKSSSRTKNKPEKVEKNEIVEKLKAVEKNDLADKTKIAEKNEIVEKLKTVEKKENEEEEEEEEKEKVVNKIENIEEAKTEEKNEIVEKLKIVEKNEFNDGFLKPTTPAKNVGYSNKIIKDLRVYKNDFHRDYFH